MVYVGRGGQVVSGTKPKSFIDTVMAVIMGIIDFIVFFFRTIFDTSAGGEYANRGNRRGGSSGGGGSGGRGPARPPPPPHPTGPRITGLSDLKDAGGNCAAGA